MIKKIYTTVIYVTLLFTGLFIFLLLLGSLENIHAATSSNQKLKSTVELPSWSLKKIQQKFRIGYFSETLGPSIKKLDDNEIANDGTKLRQPTTMYHSFNVRYLADSKFNLFLSPRISTVLGDRSEFENGESVNVLATDDWLMGFLYTFVKSSKFQYSQRLTHRHPLSQLSQDREILSQVEWQHFIRYSFSSSLTMLFWNNYRYYVFDQAVNQERYRINFRTIFNYSLSDKWSLQFSHELDLQHRNPKKTSDPSYQEPNFFKRYRNYFNFGVGFSPSRKITFIPYLRLLDERNIKNETTIVGLWILGRVL